MPGTSAARGLASQRQEVTVIALHPIESIAKERQTSLGLYVTAKEAYELWQADPAGVKVLDCRTP